MRFGIFGYGNLGRALDLAVAASGEDEVRAVFTRRDPTEVKSVTGAPVCPAGSAEEYEKEIDVMLLATGSATDVPRDAVRLIRSFHLVDSYDCHAKVGEHIASVGEEGVRTGHTALLCAGWDPGLFSVVRTLFHAIAPRGTHNTFWGRGVSQGHSEAVRRIPGVRYAKAYTLPDPTAKIAALRGAATLSDTERHTRECYIVAEEGERGRIEAQVREMPHYFAGYRTEVHFISEEEFFRSHGKNPHGGCVLSVFRSGKYRENREEMSFSLTLASNPEFTAAVMTAYARAAFSLAKEKRYGAYTPADIPPCLLLPDGEAEKYI